MKTSEQILKSSSPASQTIQATGTSEGAKKGWASRATPEQLEHLKMLSTKSMESTILAKKKTELANKSNTKATHGAASYQHEAAMDWHDRASAAAANIGATELERYHDTMAEHHAQTHQVHSELEDASN